MSRLGGSNVHNVLDKTEQEFRTGADRDSKHFAVPGMRRGHFSARLRRNWNRAKKFQLPGFMVGFLTAAWLGLAHRAPPVVVKKVVKKKPKPSLTIEELPDDGPKAPDPMADAGNPNEEMKLVLVVNEELGMTAGKIAAQCCHACLGVWKKLWRRRDPVLRVWEEGGQPKVTLQVSDEEAMLELYQRAKQIGVPTYIVVDAGRTQVAPNSRTVMAVGPASEKEVNEVTGRLKLL